MARTGFEARFAQKVAMCDGTGLYKMMRSGDRAEATPATGSGDPTAAEVTAARAAEGSEASLHAACNALRSWCERYTAERGRVQWMVPPLLQLTALPRQIAAALDQAEGTDKNQKKLVEVLREQFQRLHRDRDRREGSLAVCCELLRLYFRLGQASQCSFLLAAVREKMDPSVLPKALALPICFFWGKHCVIEGNVPDAEERLGWALAHCPPQSSRNRRRILQHLVPCRLRFGRYPRRATLERNGLECFAGLASAVSTGNVQAFNRELEKQEAELISVGTYLVVEKLKLLAYRNLCRQVHRLSAHALEAIGKGEHKHKQDLVHYQNAFLWQDGCDADETICILANLICLGAIRGYLSDEHNKIVYSKDVPFPPADTWCPKA